MKHKLVYRVLHKVLIIVVVVMLAFAPQLWAGVSAPGGPLTLTGLTVPIGGASQVPGAMRLHPLTLMTLDYQQMYDEAAGLLKTGTDFRYYEISIAAGEVISNPLQNYTDFNGGEQFYKFCADYDYLEAYGTCPPSAGKDIRNGLTRAITLFGTLAVSPANVKVRAAGEQRSGRELGRQGIMDAAREIANIHLIFGNEFLVDATDYRFSASAVGADQILDEELGQLEDATQQFSQAMNILSYAYNIPLGGDIRYGWMEGGLHMGDYFTSREFELFGTISGRLITTLGEIATRYRLRGDIEQSLAVYNQAFTTQLMQTLSLAEQAAANGQEYLVNGSWEMINNLSQMRARAQSICDGVDPFGFTAEYAPLQSYEVLLELAEDLLGDTTLPGTLAHIEEQARQAQRDFDANASDMSTQLSQLTSEYNDMLFELCGESPGETYDTCRGGLRGQTEADFKAAGLRAMLAWQRADDMAKRIEEEEKRAGRVINVILASGRSASAAALAKGKLEAYKTTRTKVTSDEGYVQAGVELSTKLVGGYGKGVLVTKAGWYGQWESAVEASFSAGGGRTWADSTAVEWDPSLEAIARIESIEALKQAEASATIEGANSVAAIRNMLIDQSELLLEMQIALEELNKLAAERNFLTQKWNRLLNERAVAANTVAENNSHITIPIYRIMRDTLTVMTAERHGVTAQFAYLVAKAAEYELVTPYPALGEIYKARTANDVGIFLRDLDAYYTAAKPAGGFNRYPYTISLAKDIWGLTDQNLDPQGLLSPQALAELRYQRFQELLQPNVVSHTLEFRFTTSLDQRRDPPTAGQPAPYLFSPNIWGNRIAGIYEREGIAYNGLSVNLVTRQADDVGQPEVKLTHAGQASYRNPSGDIVHYDPQTATPAGYVLPAGLASANTTVVLFPGINGGGAVPNAGLANLSVAAASWRFQILPHSKGNLDYSQLEDIEIVMDTSGRALAGRAQQAARDAERLQAGLALDGLDAPPEGTHRVLRPQAAIALSPQARQDYCPIAPPEVEEPEGLTCLYFGSAVITSPVPVAVQKLTFNLYDTNGILTGTIDADRTAIYPDAMKLYGHTDGLTFSLASEVVTTTVEGRPVQQRFNLSGQVVDGGEVLQGAYTGVITNLMASPIPVEGTFSASCLRQPGEGFEDLIVQAEPALVPLGGSAQVTATLFSSLTPTGHIAFGSDLGTLSPEVVEVTTDGVAAVTFTAGITPGLATIVATNGTLTDTTQIEIYDPDVPTGLQAQTEDEAIALDGSTRVSAFRVNAGGQRLVQSTRITFTTSLGQVTPGAADTDANGFAQVTFTGGITPGVATIRASDGQFEAMVLVEVVDPAVPRTVQVGAERTAIALNASTPVTAAVLNGLGQILTGTRSFSFTTDLGAASPQVKNTDANGFAEVTFTAGSAPGVATINATASDLSGKTEVEVVDPAALAQVDLQVEKAVVALNASAAVTATLYNGLGQRLTQAARITFTTDLGAVTPQAVDATNGVAVATFTAGNTPGRAAILALSGEAYGTAQVQIVADLATPVSLVLEVEPSSLLVNRVASVVATLLNVAGQPIAGTANVTFDSSLGTVTPQAVDTTSGVAMAAFNAGDVPGMATITATSGDLVGTAQVQVVADLATPASLVLEVEPSSLLVNASASVAATLLNAAGQPITQTARVTFTASTGTVTPQAVDTTGGVAMATFNAGSTPGTATITAQSGGLVGTAQVQIAADLDSPVRLVVQVEPASVPVNGGANVVATLLNAAGQPIAGTASVTFDSSLGAVTPRTVDAIGGVATAAFNAGGVPGVATITARSGGLTGTTQVHIAADLTTPVDLLLTVEPSSVLINGSTSVVATLLNYAGQPIAGTANVTFISSLGAITPQAVDTLGGVATAVFNAGSVPGAATITARSGGLVATAQVHIAADLDSPVRLVLEVEPSSVLINGSAALTATLLNAAGQPIAGTANVTFIGSLGTVTPQAADATNGVATAAFNAGDVPGAATITARSGALVGTAQVQIAADLASPVRLVVQVEPASVLVNGSASVTATLLNAAGQPIAGAANVTFISSLGTMTPQAADATNGVATAVFNAGDVPGAATIIARSGALVGTAQVQIAAGLDSPVSLVLEVEPASVLVNGSASVTATLLNVAGQPAAGTIAGVTRVIFLNSLGTVTPQAVDAIGGVATATFDAGGVPGTATIIAMSGGLVGTTPVEIIGKEGSFIYLPLVVKNK